MSRLKFRFRLGWVWNVLIVPFGTLLLGDVVLAQNNLVVNGGFESRTECPYYNYELSSCSNWGELHGTTPDFYHKCSTGNAGIPVNLFGNQDISPNDSAYVGVMSFYPGFDGAQEILVGTLNTSLEAGRKYRVRLKASMADQSQYFTCCIGVLLSSDSPPAPPFESNLSDVELVIPSNEYNTEDWYQLDAVYTAEGGENKIFIASFRPENESDIVFNANGINEQAYFYIDDVEIYEDTLTGIAENGLHQMNINVDPISQRIVADGGSGDVVMELYDMAGKLLATGGQHISTSGLAGLFVVRVLDRKGNLLGVRKVVVGL